MEPLSMNASGDTELNGSEAGHFSSNGKRPTRPFGWTWRWRAGLELRKSYVITNSTEHAPLRRFFKAAVDAVQLVFDRSLVTSVQPKSLLVKMREAVANCDDVSSDGSLMLLSPPHDLPEATLPAEASMDQETRDEFSPVVIPRRVTPANCPLQHLETGRLGASTPQHVRSRPPVPDLCIASSSLLSVLDPLPMDRLSRHTVAEIRLWPVADRHDILAVANRDVRVARQNIAEMLLYVEDHAAHLANCAINVYMVDRFIMYIFYIRFICQVQYVQ